MVHVRREGNRMISPKTAILLAVSLFLPLSPVSAERIGMRSLLVEPGVTASAMGNAYTAVADDPSALYWNVAGLVQGTPGEELLFAHTEWFLDVRQEYAVAVRRRSRDAFAAGISGFYLGGIERRESTADAEPLGDFGYYDIVVPIAYARSFGPVAGGIAVKPWYSKIDRESANGIGLDLGVLYHAPVENLRFGAALANLSSKGDFPGNDPYFLSETFSLPTEFRVGASYRFPVADRVFLLLSAQLRNIRGEEGRGDFGGDLRIHHDFSFRFGYKAGYELESWSFGFAARKGYYTIQYAAVPFSSDFGTSHRFAVVFGR